MPFRLSGGFGRLSLRHRSEFRQARFFRICGQGAAICVRRSHRRGRAGGWAGAQTRRTAECARGPRRLRAKPPPTSQRGKDIHIGRKEKVRRIKDVPNSSTTAPTTPTPHPPPPLCHTRRPLFPHSEAHPTYVAVSGKFYASRNRTLIAIAHPASPEFPHLDQNGMR